MKIVYITNARIPTEKAHGYQIMRTCLELARLGHRVSLIVPDRGEKKDPFDFYELERGFDVVKIDCFDWIKYSKILGPISSYLQSLSFIRNVYRGRKIDADSLFITRTPEIAHSLGKKGYKVIYNAHNWPKSNFPINLLLKRVLGVVCNSKGTEAAVKKILSVPTIVVNNATDQNPYTCEPKESLRNELGLPADKKIVVYTGNLYEWKGVNILVDAAGMIGSEVEFVFVGGESDTVEKYKRIIKERGIKNVSFLGYKSKNLIPKYLATADALVLPNISTTKESIEYTSPIKLFEYMASGVPIVASDLPSIREVLNDENSILVEEGNAEALSLGIKKAISLDGDTNDKSRKALEEVKKYSWEEYGKKLEGFIKKFS